jgi:hypothetical protein
MECKDLHISSKMIIAIWSFKQKWFPDGTSNKHKAPLCSHGRQQTWGQDYYLGYICTQSHSVCLLLIVAKIRGLQSKRINFVLAFPQLNLDVPIFMELPMGVNPIDISDENQHCYVLKLNKSLHCLKWAGYYNWFEMLWEELIVLDFIQSEVVIFCTNFFQTMVS